MYFEEGSAVTIAPRLFLGSNLFWLAQRGAATLDPVHRQISSATAFTNDLPRASGQFTSVLRAVNLAESFRHPRTRKTVPLTVPSKPKPNMSYVSNTAQTQLQRQYHFRYDLSPSCLEPKYRRR